MLNILGSKTNARAQILSALPFVTKREPCYDPKENCSIADRMNEKSQERKSFLQNSFLSYILYQRKENQYPLLLIANMDETPLSLNLPNSTTIKQRGTKTVSILSTGHERSNFTVVLAYLANRTKLP